ncbi:MAG: hypothetical protein N2Z84_00925 [Atribacterota bacterium]|nr:hypothetical protein [Atribacterota bacterium]
MVLHTRLEESTRRWWFYCIILLVQFLPPYPIRGITSSRDFNFLVEEVLSHALVLSWRNFYPVFKVVPLVLSILLVFFPASQPFFRLFVAFHYFILAFLQNAALLPDRGFAMLTSNVVMVTLVALSFLEEFCVRKTAFSFGRFNWKKVLLVGVVLFAFWYPVDPVSFQPRFHIVDVFANISGLTFCMMTPFYLMILLLAYPRVNRVTLRVTGLVGTIIGGYNFFLNFIVDFQRLWWNGVLHLPLLLLSSYAFGLSLKRD